MASHIGKLPVTIPAGVEVAIEGQNFSAKGAKGSDSYVIPEGITAQVEGNEIILTAADDLRPTRAKHGLSRSIIASMVKGVHDGFEKRLLIVGTGYRAVAKGKGIEFSLGYSHTITVNPPEGITFELPNANEVVVKGTDKQVVGQVAANIRKLRAPEPYKVFLAALTTMSKIGSRLPSSTPPTSRTGCGRRAAAEKGKNWFSPLGPTMRKMRCSS